MRGEDGREEEVEEEVETIEVGGEEEIKETTG